jgi:hypothetical protein
MRHVVGSLIAVISLAFAASSGASAQSALVDLSMPQTGKSRFVLNPDLTPADLGAAEEQKAVPVAAVSRVPACGEGCKMQQPDLPREPSYGYRDESGSSRTRNGTRVIFISNVNGNQPQQAAKPTASARKTFRFRRR